MTELSSFIDYMLSQEQAAAAISCGPTDHSTGPAHKAAQAGEFKR